MAGRRSRANVSGETPHTYRPLRVFAFDPMVDRFRDPCVLRVPYEPLEPGPAGRLVEVIDLDVVKGTVLAPVDLDASDVLLNQGLAPSERDPQFHQQMVYAVAMKVLETAERGLGRPIVWSAGRPLKVIPHALDIKDACFDPGSFALLFGQFSAESVTGTNAPGQTIYTCLSYDVVAHQAAHPVLSGLRDDWNEGDDGQAFHESLADLMAMLVRCAEKPVVRRAIREAGVDLRPKGDRPLALFALGRQFSEAAALGAEVRGFPDAPDLERYATEEGHHQRSIRLTSAYIEGVLDTYRDQTADIVGLAGASAYSARLHPDLVRRLAAELSTLATDTLHAVIAGFDFLPASNLDFGDFLRAFLTADQLLFGRKHARLRPHMIEAFQRRGLAPNTGSLAEEALVWPYAELPAAVRMPRASEVVGATQRAFEWRRKVLSEHPHADQAAKGVRDDARARVKTWVPEIEAFAVENARHFGLDPARPARVMNVAGAFRVEADRGLRARAVVHLVQEGERRRGVTIHSDVDGLIDLVIKSSAVERRPPARWRGSPAPQHTSLARSLRRFARES